MSADGADTVIDLDLDALREKYRIERDRRLRPDGNNQYIEVEGDFSHYVDDPYVKPGFAREPLTDEIEIAVIGGGFGGMLAAARLKLEGISDIRIIEKGGDFGGAWYWNRYPGAGCDTESYIYLPLLEETNYIPKEKYAYGPEIREHAHRIAQTFDLRANACFQTQVLSITWIEAEQRWLIATDRGDAMKARFVVMSNGVLNRPKLPGIPGIASFKGHTFHTSRWDYDYTGGDDAGNLYKLADKRVAIVGTGATAVQAIPHLGASAKALYVFQRTPSSVGLRESAPTDPEWAATLEPGWQKRRMENFNTLVSGGHQDVDLVNDGWTELFRTVISTVRATPDASMSSDELAHQMELADFKTMNRLRAQMDAIVKDSETAEALKPWYRQFCKRPCFNNDFLATFNRPNVTLVDTGGQGVERITERGLVSGGVEYEVDCIIFATGFEVGTAYTRRSGYEIYGRGGKALTEYWSDGVKTLHGFCSAGFPNCFHMGWVQNGFTSNIPHTLDEQARHLAEVLKRAYSRKARIVEATPEAEAAWVATMDAKAMQNLDFLQSCTPGFYNGEGKPKGSNVTSLQYGGGPVEFFELIAAWRSEGDMEGLEFR